MGAAGSWLARRWLLAAAVVLLAVADSASSDSATGEAGQPRPPSLVITGPADLTLVAEPSFDVTGSFSGQIQEITVSIDRGPPLGVLLDEDDTWRLPAARVQLDEGYHWFTATARGDAGEDTEVARVFHRPAAELELRLVPDRLELDPGRIGAGSAEVVVQLFAASRIRLELETRVSGADPASLAAPIRSPQDFAPGTAFFTIDGTGAAPGRYEVEVVGRGDGGTEARGVVVVDVLGPAPTTTTTRPPRTTTTTQPAAAPHTIRYEVASFVTASSTDLPASDGQATWAITWLCADGRCDAEVADGGPRGGVDFAIRYDPAAGAYAFEFVLPQPENQNCPTNEVAGTLTPTAWGPDGPVAFDYALDSALQCATGAVTVSWAGSGVVAAP